MVNILVRHQSGKIDKALKIIKRIEGFKKVKFIISYGSAAKGEMREGSDIDICIYYDGESGEASQFRFRVLRELFDDVYDVQIYQQLPLYVRLEVLGGDVIYCEDNRFLYDVAYATIKEFDDFKKRFYDYIGERAII
ncbi:MAG: nucleotidyltransferase domain-containing protein [Euryarchaeota archaeon]|nr:nucleotidyltransferase domain-containing protein [Euryarchaeota archaeon]